MAFDPDWAARLYAAAFPMTRAWSADEIAAQARAPGFVCFMADGFVLGRVAADEAELITIVIDPARQRRGAGRTLLSRFETHAEKLGATQSFLEVAADNIAAIALYDSAQWQPTGRRARYYARKTGPKIDALIYSKTF